MAPEKRDLLRTRLAEKEIPTMEIPEVYAQIGSLDQSIIVGNGLIGICLDKYLGMDYALYQKPEYGYSLEQRKMMQRQYIVPDCVGFYLLSLYPMEYDKLTQAERDLHIGRIQWTVNKAMGKNVFDNANLQKVERYMKSHKSITLEQLLSSKQYADFK